MPNHEGAGLFTVMREHGGFAPNGMTAVVGAFITIMFSFIGTESVTIAAAESGEPSRNIAKATRSVIWRIGVFYLLSIMVVISVVPWSDPQLATVGSYQRALELLDVPHAKLIVDLVVLVAVTSCMNSSIYIASRMLFSLARRGDAPAVAASTSGNGVPRTAVLTTASIGAFIAALNHFAPASLFDFLLSSSGAIALLVYLAIAISQLRMRRLHGDALTFKMWLFPWLTYGVILFISAALAVLVVTPDPRAEATSTLMLAMAVSLLGIIICRKRGKAAATALERAY